MKTKTLLMSALIGILQLSLSAQWTDQSSGITNDLNSVSFIDANNGWAVGRQGKIIYTTNGGSTWSEQNSGTTEDINKVFMVNNTAGYAVGNKGVFLSYNGTKWSKISIGFSQTMMGVYFLDESTGWISGDWGRIMKTTNGGTSWTTEMNNSIYSNQFNDLYMLSETEGWAVGSYGRVLKYNGSNWSNVSYTNPNNDAINAVYFTSSSEGIMVGESSTIFHYDGSSWDQASTSLSDNSYHVTDVFSINSTTAYATANPGFGGQGIILKYDGNTWKTNYQYSGMNTEFFDGITFVSGKGYTVGSGGMIKSMGSTGNNGIEDLNADKSTLSSYPNPFSNNANIRYSVSDNALVTIKIFDITGREVATLVNQNQGAGMYNIAFPGEQLKSGVYFVQKIQNNSTETIKLIKE